MASLERGLGPRDENDGAWTIRQPCMVASISYCEWPNWYVIEMQEAITILIFKLQTLPHADMQQEPRHISSTRTPNIFQFLTTDCLLLQ